MIDTSQDAASRSTEILCLELGLRTQERLVRQVEGAL